MKAFLAVLCLLAVAVLAQQDQCSGYTSCGSCTPVGGCGWCTYSGTCEAGNATGSYVGCTGTWWIWAETYCPVTPAPTVNCAALAASCDSCTYLGGCGWCSFINQCQAGNNTGSFEGCVAPYWSWTSNQCPAPVTTPAPTPVNTCYQYSTCQTCTGASNCGFCKATGICEVGNSTGSLSGDCWGTSWAWVNNQCTITPAPTPVNTCAQYNGNCQSCTGIQNCGFCSYSNLCEIGNSTGSLNGNCAGSYWAWVSSSCPASQNAKK